MQICGSVVVRIRSRVQALRRNPDQGLNPSLRPFFLLANMRQRRRSLKHRYLNRVDRAQRLVHMQERVDQVCERSVGLALEAVPATLSSTFLSEHPVQHTARGDSLLCGATIPERTAGLSSVRRIAGGYRKPSPRRPPHGAWNCWIAAASSRPAVTREPSARTTASGSAGVGGDEPSPPLPLCGDKGTSEAQIGRSVAKSVSTGDRGPRGEDTT